MIDVERYLSEKYEFGYNEVLNRTFFTEKVKSNKPKVLNGYKLNSIYRELKNSGLSISVQGLKSLLESDYVKRYNPIREYFVSLPKWNGMTDYIGELATTLKTTNDELFNWAFKKWLVAFVACSLNDEVTNHSVLILTGKQGSGKTTWLLNLVPNELKDYKFSGKINPNNKDSNLLLSERVLINIDELANYNKSQVEAYKELITKEVISERRAYGQFTENYVRRASFVGSSNHNQILMDVTGNRRFLVFETLCIDYNNEIDMGLVLAQALALFNSGFKFYFDNEDIKKIEENNKQFKQTNLEEEYIEKYFSIPTLNNSKDEVNMNASEIIEYLKKRISVYINFNAISIGKLLKSKGYETKKVNGISKYRLVLNKLV